MEHCMGLDEFWWIQKTSNLSSGAKTIRGRFDSYPFPPILEKDLSFSLITKITTKKRTIHNWIVLNI